jgi:hypothetical protein
VLGLQLARVEMEVEALGNSNTQAASSSNNSPQLRRLLDVLSVLGLQLARMEKKMEAQDGSNTQAASSSSSY